MKVLDATLAAHFAQAVTTTTRLLRLERRDGQVFGFTAFDRDLAFDDGQGGGQVTYTAARGGALAALQSETGLGADNTEAGWLIDDAVVTEGDLLAGIWDGAGYRLMTVNYEDLTAGRVLIEEEGELAEITVVGDRGTAKCRSLRAKYEQNVGRRLLPGCWASLGDGDCGVQLLPALWGATEAVAAVGPRDAKVGDRRRPSGFNDRFFACTTAGTTGESEPTWNTTLGATTAETLTAAAWAATTAYAAGATLLENGLIFRSSGGTSGASEPAWPANPGDTVADNDITWTAFSATPAVWTAERALTVEATVNVVTDNATFTVTYAGDAPDALLTGGWLAMTGGLNAGLGMEVKAWGLSGPAVTLFRALPFALANGDTLTIAAGCAKDRAACKSFANILNLRAFPDLPGADARMKVYRAA